MGIPRRISWILNGIPVEFFETKCRLCGQNKDLAPPHPALVGIPAPKLLGIVWECQEILGNFGNFWGFLRGAEQGRGVHGDEIQVSADVEPVDHVVGVPLPGHPAGKNKKSKSNWEWGKSWNSHPKWAGFPPFSTEKKNHQKNPTKKPSKTKKTPKNPNKKQEVPPQKINFLWIYGFKTTQNFILWKNCDFSSPEGDSKLGIPWNFISRMSRIPRFHQQ